MSWRNLEIKIIRLVLILAGVFFQTSILAIVLPRGQVPNAVLLIIVSWIVISGFEKIWPWAVTAGVIADLAFFEPVGKNVILFLIVSATINYFLKYFSMENRPGEVMAIFLVTAGAVIFDFFFNMFFAGIREIWLEEQLTFLAKSLFVQIATGFALLLIFYPLLKKIENFLDFLSSRQKMAKL